MLMVLMSQQKIVQDRIHNHFLYYTMRKMKKKKKVENKVNIS